MQHGAVFERRRKIGKLRKLGNLRKLGKLGSEAYHPKLLNLLKLPKLPNKKSQTFNEIDLTTCTTQFLVRRG